MKVTFFCADTMTQWQNVSKCDKMWQNIVAFILYYKILLDFMTISDTGRTYVSNKLENYGSHQWKSIKGL
jgi:hypothetical protein